MGAVEAGIRLALDEGLFTRTAQYRAAEMVSPPPPIVQIYGDSVSDSALNEQILEQGLRLPEGSLRNDSIPGTTAFCAYPLLARQIAAGNIPQAIVLAYNPRSYTVPLAEKFLGRFATWPELLDAWRLGVPLETWLHAVACRASFIWRYRQELNTILRAGGSWEFFDAARTPVETLAQRRKRMAAPLPADHRQTSPRGFNPEFHNAAFRRSEEIQRSLDAFFQLTRRHGIRVLIVSTPDPEGAHLYRQSNGFNHAYDAFLKELASRYGAEVVWPAIESLPAADFTDAVHLTRHAADSFTRRVQVALSPYLGRLNR